MKWLHLRVNWSTVGILRISCNALSPLECCGAETSGSYHWYVTTGSSSRHSLDVDAVYALFTVEFAGFGSGGIPVPVQQ